jgi:hypothetical protein
VGRPLSPCPPIASIRGSALEISLWPNGLPIASRG